MRHFSAQIMHLKLTSLSGTDTVCSLVQIPDWLMCKPYHCTTGEGGRHSYILSAIMGYTLIYELSTINLCRSTINFLRLEIYFFQVHFYRISKSTWQSNLWLTYVLNSGYTTYWQFHNCILHIAHKMESLCFVFRCVYISGLLGKTNI